MESFVLGLILAVVVYFVLTGPIGQLFAFLLAAVVFFLVWGGAFTLFRRNR